MSSLQKLARKQVNSKANVISTISISGVKDLNDSHLKAPFYVLVYALGPNSECDASCL